MYAAGQPVFDVTYFGAKGDGVTNDAEAIDAWIETNRHRLTDD